MRSPASTILLLHGFLGSSSDWAKFTRSAEALNYCADDFVRVDLVRLASVMWQERREAPTLSRLADAAVREAMTRGSGVIDVVGYSLGGRVAIEALECAASDRVRRAVLVSAHPGIDDSTERAARSQRDTRWAEELEAIGATESKVDALSRARSWLEAWYAQELFAPLRVSSAFPAALERRVEALASGEAAVWARIQRACSPGGVEPRWDAIERHHERVHLIVGARDRRYVEVFTRARALGLSTNTIPDAGHALPLEAPDALAREVFEFLGCDGPMRTHSIAATVPTTE